MFQRAAPFWTFNGEMGLGGEYFQKLSGGARRYRAVAALQEFADAGGQ